MFPTYFSPSNSRFQTKSEPKRKSNIKNSKQKTWVLILDLSKIFYDFGLVE